MLTKYFVVGAEQIIAQDLVHAIQACDAQADVRVFFRAEDAHAALSDGRPRLVILHREPGGFADTPLGQALAEQAVAHAFLSTFEREEGARILVSPFTEETVAALLRELA